MDLRAFARDLVDALCDGQAAGAAFLDQVELFLHQPVVNPDGFQQLFESVFEYIEGPYLQRDIVLVHHFGRQMVGG